MQTRNGFSALTGWAFQSLGYALRLERRYGATYTDWTDVFQGVARVATYAKGVL